MFSRNDLYLNACEASWTSLPFQLSGVMDLRRAGKGYKVKVFSSLELAACWERVAWKIDALEKRLGGHNFNSVKATAGLSFFPLLSPAPFLTNPWREKNLFRRYRQNKNTPFITAVLYLCYLCYKLHVKHSGDRLDFIK